MMMARAVGKVLGYSCAPFHIVVRPGCLVHIPYLASGLGSPRREHVSNSQAHP
jgi:hypothetical protein